MSRKEGGKIFGSGSRTPIAITLLVKNPNVKTKKATIHYHDIGDYLDREQKLKIIKGFKSFNNSKLPLIQITPNAEGDWISMRNSSFENFIVFGDKKENKSVLFNIYTAGVITNRESWVYSFSKENLKTQVSNMIDFFNQEVERFKLIVKENPKVKLEEVVSKAPNKIKWDQGLMEDAIKSKKIDFDEDCLRIGLYRPFFKQNLYFNKNLNWSRYQLPSILPNVNLANLLICVSGSGGTKEFSCVITNCIPDRQMQFNGQCFPLYYYEENKTAQKSLFDANDGQKYIRRDAISNFIFERAKQQYGKSTTKEDIFYYVYGFLHSKEYRETFANDLKKMLPRLPLVEDVKDFWAFSKAGRKLADLHLNYEHVPPYDGVIVTGAEKLSFIDTEPADTKLYLIEKMRFPKKDQKDTILYNSHITVSNIPAKAYEYVVNGKSAIEWIMERYQITTHKESGIKNDPNDWATEVGNPRYILDLLLSIINVSVQTVDIVNSLPKLNFE